MKSKGRRNLKEFEPYIHVKAKYYSKRDEDIEDFQQEGRTAAWLAIQRDPNATKSYVYQAIDWAMLVYVDRVIYKNPEEASANELFGGFLWGESAWSDD